MGEAREIGDAITDAVINRDFDRLGSFYAEDAVITDPQTGEMVGGVVEFLRAFADAFPDLAFESRSKHEAGNVAIDEGWVTGTNTGPITLPSGETLPPTGKPMRLRSCDIVTVENGKVVRHDFYYDQVELLGQLGLLPQLVGA